MLKSKWFFHPVSIFIFSLVALGTSLFLFIRSYLQVNHALQVLIEKYKLNPNTFVEGETWVIIVILSILVALIIAGMVIIFVYYQKMIQLYRLQQNFINGFTHELKTPIASLQLFLETFSKHDIPKEDFHRYLEFMKRDTKRLAENVARILQLGKLEDKSFKADFHFQDLVSLMQDFFSQTPHLFEEGEVVFHSEIKEAHLNVDRGLFEMLLMNLITNGFRYNKSEKKIVNVRFYKNKKKAFLDITDNGIGIEKSEIKKIFRKFYQVGKTTKGSGLGLYIAQSICRLHKIEIDAHSEGKGMGTTIRLSMPLKMLWINDLPQE